MRHGKRGISAGTVFMLILTAVVLITSGAIWIRLKSGEKVDLTNLKLPEVLALQQPAAQNSGEDAVTLTAVPPQPTASVTVLKTDGSGEASAAGGSTLTITAGGTLAVEKNLRQSAYTSDTKVYDFTDMMALLKNSLRGDLNTVFLENILMDDVKVSENVVPTCAADMMLQAGFNVCMAGYESSWEKKMEGVNSTMSALHSRRMSVLGLLENEADTRFLLQEINGIRIAVMQYTSRVASSVRQNMSRNSAEWAVTAADMALIKEDLTEAMEAGAEICIVYLQWGKDLSTTPSMEQRTMAKKLADAGADVIIGAGSRITQSVEYLEANDGRKVLCAWSLGSLMTDERGSANRIGGILLHLTFRKLSGGSPVLEKVAYTPTYVWKYKQDSHYYYKCLPANQPAPDGMDSDQARVMQKALEAVRKTLVNSPVEEW